jgi:predicted enzyme related to lactoylglutathione lyase
MPVRLTSIQFEAADVDTLVDFWQSEFDRWRVEPAGRGEVRLVPDPEDGSPLSVMISPATPRPKSGKNRIHIDLNTHHAHDYQSQRDGLGYFAPVIDIGQGELVPWTVFADPEGNEFCLLKPRDRYKDAGVMAALVVDCADPTPLARFWSAMTGWEITETAAEFAALRSGSGPFIEFSHVAARNSEPSPVSLRFESYWPHQHDDDVASLVSLGARVVRKVDGPVPHTVLADPEGNEFRVVIPEWPPVGTE